jgi:predicted O-methyltransferase YrrM
LIRPPVERTLARLRPPSPAAFIELERRAAEIQREHTSPEVGRLLEAMAACQPAGRILELGAGWGGTTLWLATGARQAAIVAVDRDAEALGVARELLDRCGLGRSVEWIAEEARAAVERAVGPFDLVVIDLPAGEARRLVDLVLPRVAVGGRIAILGALRDLAAGPAAELASAEVRALEQLRPYLLIHPQLASALLPVGNGVLLGVKRRETMRELGGPY